MLAFLCKEFVAFCTYSHYRAGIVALRTPLASSSAKRAELTRTLMNAALYLHDHIVHFYQLHGMDWADVVSALSADVHKASEEAFKYTKARHLPRELTS